MPTPDAVPPAPFVVVGLGASAGGLGALTAFFSGLPETDGAAFVVVIHLAPDRESEMAQILARSVPIPVVQIRERTRVERGTVYVVPPNRNLTMADGHLDLEPLETERQRRRPVDHFFRTLAHAYGSHAIAVVLSGTGHNGTVGVRAVKEAGGLVLAQSDAEFDEMPRTAIASGVVDAAAPAQDLGALAIGYAHRLGETQLLAPDVLPEDDVRAVQRVLRHLRVRTGHDFCALQAEHRPAAARAPAPRRRPREHRRVRRAPAPRRRRGAGALERPPDLGDELFPRPGRLRRARHARRAAPVRGQGAGRRRPRVGRRLRDGRGGVLGRDAARRARGDAARAAARPGFRDRPERGRHPHRPRGRLPRVHRGRRHRRASAPLFPPRRARLPRLGRPPRERPFRAAQPAQRPAVLARRARRLPQPAHLLRAHAPAARARPVPLRAHAGRLPVSRLERDRGAARGRVPRRGQGRAPVPPRRDGRARARADAGRPRPRPGRPHGRRRRAGRHVRERSTTASGRAPRRRACSWPTRRTWSTCPSTPGRSSPSVRASRRATCSGSCGPSCACPSRRRCSRPGARARRPLPARCASRSAARRRS